MVRATERVSELVDGVRRKRKVIVSPEGVPLDVQVAGHMERLGAFAVDMLLMGLIIAGLYALILLLFFYNVPRNLGILPEGSGISVAITVLLFVAFLVRTGYFLHFELAWQGRTPGKKLLGLRSINRSGGELTPSAIIARNLTREVEIFLPLALLCSLDFEGFWQNLALFGWVLLIASLPLFNRDHLRAGDIIGGTQVIAMPKRVLLADLVLAAPAKETTGAGGYVFTHEQLAIYGAFELQVLEEFLRQPDSQVSRELLEGVCAKIRRKIGWE
ncbi:MAG: RDD family protein, partial [Deltaproteobacteria bacterium]|nr:RDD family protein [Deltaproteobacteria bacterium]